MKTEEICRTYTDLSGIQIQLLSQIALLLPFAATISGCEVCLFTCSKEALLTIGHYSGKEADRRVSGQKVKRGEMPLWEEALRTGRPVRGKQESDYGILKHTAVFPIVDNGGKIIGGLAFIGAEKGNEFYLLAETAFMAIMVPDSKLPKLYEPFSYRDGLIIFSEAGTILYANEVASHLVNLLGVDKRLVGMSVFGGNIKLFSVKQALAAHQGMETEEIYGDIVLLQQIIPVISGGKPVRSYLVLKDRTVQRESEQQLMIKNSVIKEIHHRVKNNLQTVAGLLRMQARRTHSFEVKEALQESVSRIESMSLVHDIISHYEEDYIDIRTISEELMRLLRHSMLEENQNITCEYRGISLRVPSARATYLSLVLNELISNAFKHGLKGEIEGSLVVEVVESTEQVLIVVTDSGKGVKESFDFRESAHLGLQIIRNLVENECKGSIEFIRPKTKGLTVKLSFAREDIGL